MSSMEGSRAWLASVAASGRISKGGSRGGANNIGSAPLRPRFELTRVSVEPELDPSHRWFEWDW